MSEVVIIMAIVMCLMQKFKFCGGGDCPEWLLVQINALSRMVRILRLKIPYHSLYENGTCKHFKPIFSSKITIFKKENNVFYRFGLVK